jgi:DNA-directed RNA polymerase specialized sigma24 family protein
VRSTRDGRSDVDTTEFEHFVHRTEPRLRRALMAALGSDSGREATAEALAWAWAHRDRLDGIDDPVSYLYRVGQSRTRRPKTRLLRLPGRPEWSEPWIEPTLSAGLAALSEKQRVAVVLVHGYAWTHREVGELLGIRGTTVQTHLDRGMARLRNHLKADVQ